MWRQSRKHWDGLHTLCAWNPDWHPKFMMFDFSLAQISATEAVFPSELTKSLLTDNVIHFLTCMCKTHSSEPSVSLLHYWTYITSVTYKITQHYFAYKYTEWLIFVLKKDANCQQPADHKSISSSIKDLEKRISDLSSVRRHYRYPSAVDLQGQASQVLWQLSKGATEADLVKLLSNRWVRSPRQSVSQQSWPAVTGSPVNPFRQFIKRFHFGGHWSRCTSYSLTWFSTKNQGTWPKATTLLDEATGECEWVVS